MSTLLGFNNSFYSNVISPQGVGGQILARVDKVILGPTDVNGNPDPDFEANGRWASIGAIKFTVLYGSEPLPSDSPTVARPSSPNITNYPVLNEIVELIPGPSTGLNSSGLAKTLYYRSAMNTWNNVHHNALPNVATLAVQTGPTATNYLDASRGATYAPTTGSQTISLGATFKEKPYIKNLQPFEGDYTIQGRWGQSIRFGSTVRSQGAVNPWSSAGEEGDPILILRNGQGDKSSLDPFTTTIENINIDGCSIYLCAGQVVVVEDLINFYKKLDTFRIGSKLGESQVQRLNSTPVSTDSTSPAVQSQNELSSAQASAQTVVPSTVPQSKTTVEVRQPTTGSNPTAVVTTQTTTPEGAVITTVVNTQIDPNSPVDIGKVGTDAIKTPNKTEPTQSQSSNNSNNAANSAQPNESLKTVQDTLPEGLEVITADEATIRFGFDVDNVDVSVETEGIREQELLNSPEQIELQKKVEEVAGDDAADGQWESINKVLLGIYAEKSSWKETGSNPKILNTFKEVGAPKKSDSVAWCASFVGYVLKTAGTNYLKGNLSSIAYKDYGTEVPLDKPSEWRQWDIAVWAHTKTPGTGHVAFLNGVTGTGKTVEEQTSALGGNQSNGVSIQRYPYKGSDMKLIAIRRGFWIPPNKTLAKATGDIGGSTV